MRLRESNKRDLRLKGLRKKDLKLKRSSKRDLKLKGLNRKELLKKLPRKLRKKDFKLSQPKRNALGWIKRLRKRNNARRKLRDKKRKDWRQKG